jgi:hypothetical protein
VSKLLGQAAAGQPAAGAEAAVVAKDAPADGHRAIDVRAGEASVEADLMDPLAEPPPQEVTIGVVP